MISRKFAVFFASILWYSANHFHVGKSENATGVNCDDEGGFYNVNTTIGKAYRDNLESLLEVLASNASHPNGFYNYTAGSSGGAAANGLFLCRGDAAAAVCQACVDDAKHGILQTCTNNTRATIWYDKCMLRYSDDYIFSRLDTDFTWYISTKRNVSDAEVPWLNLILGNSFDEITSIIKHGNDSGKKFAVHEANFTLFQKIFALGQCTPDLSNLDCQHCLRYAIGHIPACCSNRSGGSVFTPSCNIRYDTSPFYENLAALPPISGLIGSNNQVNYGRIRPRMSMVTIVAIAIPTAIAIAAFAVVLFCIVRRAKNNKRQDPTVIADVDDISTGTEFLRSYSLAEVLTYTNNFNKENEIGQGGFGTVYKGFLPNGQIVAMKRLSKRSSQGAKEFMNEISLVAKLQHKNLIRLLGYCLEEEEKILIYEFVTNKSLDYFLFDPHNRSQLDWSKRYRIIGGIARGLIYLHEDSRIKIIHRDLKAGNVLLDQNMNAKIADFGLARLFENDQSHGSTSKIIGTYGYMAPEYMFHGKLSVKSDVFSFGVLILEIISGIKIRNPNCFGTEHHLLTCAWNKWSDGTLVALVDQALGSSYVVDEVTRCVHIGLLCVVEDAERRPKMAEVVSMLNSNSVPESSPNQPAFYERSIRSPREVFIDPAVSSRNEASITELYPR